MTFSDCLGYDNKSPDYTGNNIKVIISLVFKACICI